MRRRGWWGVEGRVAYCMVTICLQSTDRHLKVDEPLESEHA